jgi:hypothetical protein
MNDRSLAFAAFTASALIAAALFTGCSDDIAKGTPKDGGTEGGTNGPLRFVAVGDTGKGNDGQHAVANAMANRCATRGCDFAILLGDNIYESGITSPDDPQMQAKFEQVYAAVPVEFQIVLGNHDYGGEGLGTEFGKAAFEIAYSARSQKWRLPAAHYHFTKPLTEFFVLDTNLMMFGRDADQKTNIPPWIAASTARWKIALGHHPYISNGPHGNAGFYDGVTVGGLTAGSGVKDFMDQYVCGKVDLYLGAHDHSMQWLAGTCNGTALILSGAGAQPTTLPGKNATSFQSTALGFLYVTITEAQLTAEFVDSTGATVYSNSLVK